MKEGHNRNGKPKNLPHFPSLDRNVFRDTFSNILLSVSLLNHRVERISCPVPERFLIKNGKVSKQRRKLTESAETDAACFRFRSSSALRISILVEFDGKRRLSTIGVIRNRN